MRQAFHLTIVLPLPLEVCIAVLMKMRLMRTPLDIYLALNIIARAGSISNCPCDGQEGGIINRHPEIEAASITRDPDYVSFVLAEQVLPRHANPGR